MEGRSNNTVPPGIPSTPTIWWLLSEAASLSTTSSLLSGLCTRLAGEGLHISGAVLTVASLDPMIARTRIHWEREGGRVVSEVLLHGMTLEASGAKAESLQFTLAEDQHQIEWLAGAGGFEEKEQNFLKAISIVMAAPLQAVVAREITRKLLQAYLGRRSADKVLSGSVRRGMGELIEAVIWISDLRNFTPLSFELAPHQLITALNDCCARLVGAVHPFGGEVLKFIGDGLLAVFPFRADDERTACDGAIAAVRAARKGMALLDAERRRAQLPALPFGVALHLGSVVYGNIGAPDRLDFTAIGPAVNIASRIESLCRSLDIPALISDAVASRCSTPLAVIGQHSLPGAQQSITLYTLPELL